MASAVLALTTRAAAAAPLRPPQVAALAVRYASKKTGGSSKNLGGKSRGKSYGIKKLEGEVNMFMPATSLGLSANFAGTQAPTWAWGRGSVCTPWRRGSSATRRTSTCPTPRTQRLWIWSPGCPRALCSIRLLSTWFLPSLRAPSNWWLCFELLVKAVGLRLEPK